MCGLTGFVARHSDLPEERLRAVVREMTETLRHRGPDDSGLWVDSASGVALGHRRLAILDLSPEGRQPMASASGRYVLAYNGEVYNFPALRAELERRGYSWRGHSDTEVILAAIETWGVEAAVGRFVGMFAFTLWDRQQRTLWLARDRLGIKPLYYGRIGGSFVFASELHAFHAFPGFTAQIDPEALALLLRHSCIPAPLAIFRGVAKLPPGHLLRLQARDKGEASEELRPYWSIAEVAAQGLREPFSGTEEEARQELDRLLREAVGMRMVADVPLGAFLSGGIDSSLVVALMQAQSARPVKTFTIGSPDRRYDESGHAAAVARHLGTDHWELLVTAQDALAVIPDLAEVYDEPFADSSQLPTLLVSRLARREVTVALSGDGGDEVFAGYVRHALVPRLWRLLRPFPPAARMAAARLLEGEGGRRLARLMSLLPGAFHFSLPEDKIGKLARVLPARSVEQLYAGLVSWWEEGPAAVPGAAAVRGPWAGADHWPDALDLVTRLCCADLQGYLADDILVKVDRASMSVGLEARVPLLDHRVVEFSLSLPSTLKVRDGKGKWLLRQVVRDYLPDALLERPKMGFAVPVADWLRGPLREWTETMVGEERLRREGMLNCGIVRSLWQEHLQGRHDRGFALWNVLMFQAWLDRLGSKRVASMQSVEL